MAKVIPFLPTRAMRTPIGHAIRTGEAFHRRLEDLHAEGRLPARTVIVDESKARFQKEFIRSLKALSDWRKRIDSMTRMFETLSERNRPSPLPLRRQGPGAPTHRSSA